MIGVPFIVTGAFLIVVHMFLVASNEEIKKVYNSAGIIQKCKEKNNRIIYHTDIYHKGFTYKGYSVVYDSTNFNKSVGDYIEYEYIILENNAFKFCIINDEKVPYTPFNQQYKSHKILNLGFIFAIVGLIGVVITFI